MILHVMNMLEKRGLADQVDTQKVMQTVEEQTGMPVDITKRTATSAGAATSSLRY
jgi:hypothetical protein